MPLRILHAVEFYPPSRGGAQEVVRQVSERLVGAGHDVTVATSAAPGRNAGMTEGVRVEEFDVSGNEVRGMVGEIDRYQQFVSGGGFDVVMTYAAQQWTTDALLPVMNRIRAPVILAPCGFSGLADHAYARYFDRLGALIPNFDAVIVHSDTYQDAAFAREFGARNLRVIPNGADEREFGALPARDLFRREFGLEESSPLVITVGGHTGLKGHEQAMRAFLESSGMPGATLAILANHPTGRGCGFRCRQSARIRNLVHRGRRIIVAEAPRDTVINSFAAADLFLFCSLVECSPLVLFEAMAAGLPFVSVDVGNAAEIAKWGGGGVVVPSTRDEVGRVHAPTDEVAKSIDGLMSDPVLREQMGQTAREAWRKEFTWAEIASRYERVYEEIAR